MNTKKKLKGKLLYYVLKPAVKAGIRCVQAYPRDEEQATQPKKVATARETLCIYKTQYGGALAPKGSRFSYFQVAFWKTVI